MSSHIYHVANVKENKFNEPAVWPCASTLHKRLLSLLFSLFSDLSSPRPEKLWWGMQKAQRGHVFLIMETERKGENLNFHRWRKKNSDLSFFLSLFLVHEHTARAKCTVIKAVSIHYVVKGGEGNDWCTWELKFNWRTQLSVIAAIHQLDPETPLFQEEKGRRFDHFLRALGRARGTTVEV